MAYRVEISRQALADAEGAGRFLAEHSGRAATRWFDGLMAAVASLADMPARCPVAREAETIARDLRQLLYGDRRRAYRILFLIDEDATRGPEVRIVAIRHGARRPLEPEDLDWLDEDQ